MGPGAEYGAEPYRKGYGRTSAHRRNERSSSMSRRIRIVAVCTLCMAALTWAVLAGPAGPAGRTAHAEEITGTPTPAATATPTPAATPTAEVTPTSEVTPTAEATPTATATPTPTVAPEGINWAHVLYTKELIEIDSKAQVYYGTLKKGTDTGIKQSELIAAPVDDYGYKYYIDISMVSASKDSYIGITTTLTPGSDGLVPVMAVKIAANQKKIVFDVNWAIEGSEAKGAKILQDVVITTNDSQTFTYKHSPDPNKSDEKNISELNIQWRKGSNGDWNSIADLSRVEWEAMKNSGALIYFRTAAKDQTDESEGARISKENKVKCNITKATAVKVDVNKVTLSLKNGMQFRMSGTTTWYTILPYSGSATSTEAMRSRTLTTLFDPFTENTKGKVTYLSVDEVYTMIGYVAPAEPTPVVLDVRIAATTKKPASRISTVTIPLQAEAPTAAVAIVDGKYKVTTLKANEKDTVTSPAFEYFVCHKADVAAGYIDVATLKWATVKEGTVLANTLRSSYTRTDGKRQTCEITAADAVLLVRRRGVAASSKSEAALASKYVMVVLQ